jgi:hypothetical protein
MFGLLKFNRGGAPVGFLSYSELDFFLTCVTPLVTQDVFLKYIFSYLSFPWGNSIPCNQTFSKKTT